RHATADLVDLDGVGGELQRRHAAGNALVAVGRLVVQRQRQVVADGVAGVLGQVEQHLDRSLGVLALAGEVGVEVRLAGRVDHEVGRVPLDGLGVVDADYGGGHGVAPGEGSALMRLWWNGRTIPAA